MPFWSLAQLGNVPEETLKQHLKSQAVLKAETLSFELTVSLIKLGGRVNEHISN